MHQMDAGSYTTLHVHPITLTFEDADWERAYAKQQQQHLAGSEPWLLNMVS